MAPTPFIEIHVCRERERVEEEGEGAGEGEGEGEEEDEKEREVRGEAMGTEEVWKILICWFSTAMGNPHHFYDDVRFMFSQSYPGGVLPFPATSLLFPLSFSFLIFIE